MITECSKCLHTDEHDNEIKFDINGECSYCTKTALDLKEVESNYSKFNEIINQIKNSRSPDGYDCILGMSGGVDSSFVAHLAKINNLNPLIVHFDNGWNSELSVDNIYKIVKKNNFDLYTLVVDWDEFKDIQKSVIKSGVVDIEMVTDHAIGATLLKLAKERKIRYMLSGSNVATESVMPSDWSWSQTDFRNIKYIQKEFGTKKIKTFPHFPISRFLGRFSPEKTEFVHILNYYPYKKYEAIKILEDCYDWREYGGKHYESTFTKFYQAYILPKKFKIDKRIAHLSALIRNGEISKKMAKEEIESPLYSEKDLKVDMIYFCKKLDFSIEEFEKIMKQDPVPHDFYKNDRSVTKFLISLKNKLFIK